MYRSYPRPTLPEASLLPARTGGRCGRRRPGRPAAADDVRLGKDDRSHTSPAPDRSPDASRIREVATSAPCSPGLRGYSASGTARYPSKPHRDGRTVAVPARRDADCQPGRHTRRRDPDPALTAFKFCPPSLRSVPVWTEVQISEPERPRPDSPRHREHRWISEARCNTLL